MAQNIEIKKFGLRFGYHDALYPHIPYKTPQIAHGFKSQMAPKWENSEDSSKFPYKCPQRRHKEPNTLCSIHIQYTNHIGTTDNDLISVHSIIGVIGVIAIIGVIWVLLALSVLLALLALLVLLVLLALLVLLVLLALLVLLVLYWCYWCYWCYTKIHTENN